MKDIGPFILTVVASITLSVAVCKVVSYCERRRDIDVWDKYGYKYVTLTYDEVYDLKRILRHEGLTKEKLNCLYGLKSQPVAVGYKGHSIEDSKRYDVLKELASDRLIEQRDGVWVLSPTGQNVVAD